MSFELKLHIIHINTFEEKLEEFRIKFFKLKILLNEKHEKCLLCPSCIDTSI